MFVRRHIIPILLSAALLLSGVIAVTHTHVHEHVDANGVVTNCSHEHDGHLHSHDSPSLNEQGTTGHSHAGCCSTDSSNSDSVASEQPPSGQKPVSPCNHEHDEDCFLCQLIANFSATITSSFVASVDGAVVSIDAESPSVVVIESTLRVRGRAPPIC